MPTKYTELVQTGQVTKLEDFALRCARNFVVSMRGGSLDSPIPLEFKPDVEKDLRKIEKYKQRISETEQWTEEYAAQLAQKAYDKTVVERAREKEEYRQTMLNYSAMMFKVDKWQPPTPHHQELRQFMLTQLVNSVDFDCNYSDDYWQVPPAKSGAQYKADELGRLRREIQYLTDSIEQKRRRAAEATEWLKQLRQSLAEFNEAEASLSHKKSLLTSALLFKATA